jgi:predicted ATPase
MRALAVAGRTPEALGVYQRHRDHVRDELGLDPSPALRELHTRILRSELPTSATVVKTPAPTPPPPPRRELPRAPSPVIGRVEELGQLGELLSTRQLMTLVGPGGVGKTRTALELAHRAAAAGRPVWWVDLVPVTEERLVDAVAAGADVELGGGDDVEDLCRGLGERRGLLVLDNAEHLLGPVAALVERLLDTLAGLTVFVTSRERLALDVETVRVLAPLPVPANADVGTPAVRLFIERAPGMSVDSLTAEELSLVALACRQLDGLPLAIELGAARAHALGLPALLDRLGSRLDLLAGGRRTADRRHRTLRGGGFGAIVGRGAVVEWSHELLTADEAVLFARLAVFPAAFGLEQAEAVCADERLARAAIAPLLARLVEQSLLRRIQDRFSMLETLRVFASEQLDRFAERDLLSRRHAYDTADRLAAQSARLWTSEEPLAVAVLSELVDDLHTAFRYAIEHDRPLAVRLAGDVHDFAYFRQRLDLLGWATAVTAQDAAEGGQAGGGVSAAAWSRALATAAVAAWSRGRIDEAAALVARAARAGCGPGLPATALARKVGADLAMFGGRTEEAVQRYRALATSWRSAGQPVQALLFEFAAAQSLANAGRTGEATVAVEHLLASATATANPTLMCWANYVHGLVVEPVDPQRAHAAYTAAVEHGVAVDSRLFVNLAHSSAAALTAHLAPEAAFRSFAEVLDRWGQLGNEMVQSWVLSQLAVLFAELGYDADAAVLAGAVRATGGPRPRAKAEIERFNETLAVLRARLGADRTESALAAGGTLDQHAVVAHARRVLATHPADRVRVDEPGSLRGPGADQIKPLGGELARHARSSR